MQRLMPYFNRQHNDYLILAIQLAGVERGRNGFRKTSPQRKIPSLRRICWSIVPMAQMLLIRCILGGEKFPQHDFYGGFVGRVR